MAKLRVWQKEALSALLGSSSKDFLAVATPGAGKTTFALTAASHYLKTQEVVQLVVVAPTEHLKKQWADAAAKFGIMLDPTWGNSSTLMKNYHGVVVTYAQVSLDPQRHARGVSAKSTLVILDEVHHAGDSLSWGDGVKTAFNKATRRLMLSGSPWRSDINPIPFVSYQKDEMGVSRSKADYTYGYGEALRDNVVRPVMFLAYSGTARWLDSDGFELDAQLDAELDRTNSGRALRSALDPSSDWVGTVLATADDKLNQLRAEGIKDAGGLVLASSKIHARAYARQLEAYTGEKVALALSEDPNASATIEKFARSREKWLVAVRMVSEGVDIPRLAVGVYATNSSTALFFTQAIGRFVRARKIGESATVFIPAVPSLLKLSSEIEVQRDHALKQKEEASSEELLSAANRSERGLDAERYEFKALGSSAQFERAIYNGTEVGPQDHAREAAESHILGLNLLQGEMIGQLPTEEIEEMPLHRRIKEARKTLAKEVAAKAADTMTSHASIHTYLRQVCGGPSVATATIEELEARIERLRLDAMPAPVVVKDDEPFQMSLF